MTRAEELAEKVRAVMVGSIKGTPAAPAAGMPAVERGWDALSELVADAEALAEALAEIDELAPDDMEDVFNCGRHDEPNHDHEFYFQLWDHGFSVGLQRMGNIARDALASYRGEK